MSLLESHWHTQVFTRSTRRGAVPEYDGVDDQLAAARSRYDRISPRAAYQELLYERAVIVDTRPIAQREAFGVIHPDLQPLVVERNVLEWRFDPRQDARLDIASFDLRVLVLCQEGFSSSLAADSLVHLGVHKATDVIGGFRAWQEAGLPTA